MNLEKGNLKTSFQKNQNSGKYLKNKCLVVGKFMKNINLSIWENNQSEKTPTPFELALALESKFCQPILLFVDSEKSH